MASEREGRIWRFNCDGPRCHKNHESEDTDFGEAWQAAQADGWVNYQQGSEWKHLCPTCKRLAGD